LIERGTLGIRIDSQHRLGDDRAQLRAGCVWASWDRQAAVDSSVEQCLIRSAILGEVYSSRSGPARDGARDCAPGWHAAVGRRAVATALLWAARPPISAGVTATRSPTGQRRRRRARPAALVDVADPHDGRYAHLCSPSRLRSPSGLAGCTAPLGFTPLGRHRGHPEAHGRVQLQPAPGCDHCRSHAVQ
jgi:hypothetical protein